MREPSIHITKSKLRELIESYIEQDDSNRVAWPYEPDELLDDLVNYLSKRGSRYQLSRRKRLIGELVTPKIQKKISMNSRSYKADAQMFAKVLVSVRKAKKHRGINIIKEGNKEWNILKEVTSLATSFSEDFGLSLKDGYTEYIKTAILIMPSFSLNRINFKHEEICKTYEALLEIARDSNKNLTNEVYDAYYQIVSAKTGITNDYRNRPLKFVYFVRASKAVNELKVSAFDYVKAQFKSLEWINGLPDPSQLTGDGAVERLQKHLYANKKSVIKDETELRKIMLGG